MADKEYIERGALLKYIDDELFLEQSEKSYLKMLVRKQPTADVVEVRHGEWVEHPEDWRMQMVGDKCSLCGWAVFGGVSEFNYCPNCGAKMDGKGEG